MVQIDRSAEPGPRNPWRYMSTLTPTETARTEVEMDRIALGDYTQLVLADSDRVSATLRIPDIGPR
jgi:hypothetical protein